MAQISDTIKIIIIDDHRLFSDGLCAMLKPEPGIEVLDCIYDSREACRKVDILNPDVVLVDFNMPYINGIELTKLLREKDAGLKILILSMYKEERYIDLFRKAGISGYVLKTASAKDVVTGIEAVYAGQHYFPSYHSKSNHSADDFLKTLKISNREMEVINLIKSGLTTKEIADKLKLSFYTVETHRKNIKLKAGLKGESDFLRFIYEL
jgi:two-component system nitrate/nitrite response regulator NarL